MIVSGCYSSSLSNSFHRETRSPEIAFSRLYNQCVVNRLGEEAGTGQRPVSAVHAPPVHSGRCAGQVRGELPPAVIPRYEVWDVSLSWR